MSTKNKNKTTVPSPAEKVISDLGFVVMSAAAVVSLLELHDMRAPKLAPSVHTGASAIIQNVENRVEELVRREKEETAHAVVSYGQAMRSHPVTGKA